MLKRYRTKLIALLAYAAFSALVYFGYDGPGSDRHFLLQCLVVMGVVPVCMLAVARVLRCPRCGADMGRFEGLPAFRRFRVVLPRYIKCRYCGCEIDRHDDNREVK